MKSLGIDIGSSSVKVSLLDIASGECAASSANPATEMPIGSPQSGWAEQDPEMWWHYVCEGIRTIAAQGFAMSDVVSVGITYQMHGLVCLDKQGRPLRPSIIWCDSRAVEIGAEALEGIGREFCLAHTLNSPGNFTASKLAWVRRNEPGVFAQIYKFMLPGDYIAYRLSGRMSTSVSGLSEQILWDFEEERRADFVAGWYGIPQEMIPEAGVSIGTEARTDEAAERLLGIPAGTPISYRRRGPAQQRLFTQRHGGGRSRRNRRHERRGIRRHGQTPSRPAVAREHLRPRQSHGQQSPLRHSALHQRHGHHELVDTPQRHAGDARLCGDEPAGRKRPGRFRRAVGRTLRQRSRTGCSATAAPEPESSDSISTATPRPTSCVRRRRASPTPSATASTSCAGWECAPTSSAQAQQTCSSRRFSADALDAHGARIELFNTDGALGAAAARRWAPATTRRAAKRSPRCAGWRSWNPPKLTERRWKKVTGHGSGK